MNVGADLFLLQALVAHTYGNTFDNRMTMSYIYTNTIEIVNSARNGQQNVTLVV